MKTVTYVPGTFVTLVSGLNTYWLMGARLEPTLLRGYGFEEWLLDFEDR